jgi:hypothetical protein
MKEGTCSSLSSYSFLVLERSIVFGGISRHHHTENNALVRCVFATSQHTARLLVYVMNCTPAEDFQIEQRITQKFKRNHFNNIH